MKVGVYIQGQRLDLYEDESINVKQVTKDLKDISKVFTDFSQTFRVPASRNNNIILKNWYNADIDNGFDARLRVDGRITINTIDFKLGKFRLDGADVKHNKPTSYRLTFFGNTIQIKDLIGEDELSDLVWLDNFNHAYDGSVVKNGLTNGLDFTVDSTTYSDAIIYPLISYQRQWYYNSDPTDDTGTDQLVNIAYSAGKSNGIISGNLKPAIKLHLIVKAIEEQYEGLDFSSSFFDSLYFTNIYVNLNRNTDPINTGYLLVEEETGTTSLVNPVSCDYFVSVVPDAGFEDVGYKIKLTVNGQVSYESVNFLTGAQTRGTGYADDYNNEYDVKCEIITQQDFEFSINTTFQAFSFQSGLGTNTVIFTNSYASQVIALEARIRNELPEIKVYDFITNLFKIFNLVAYSDLDQIVVQDLQSWYSNGQIYDVSKWIDLESEQIKRGEIYKNISFTYEPTEQILANQFEQANNQRYGELEFNLTDENGDSRDIDGGEFKVESIFENPIHERLFDADTNEQTSIQYTPYFDEDINPISGNFFMFFGAKTLVSQNNIGFVNDGVYEDLGFYAFMPSHSYLINGDSFNLNFNAEVSEYTYGIMRDTIYKRYYDDYLSDMFSVKRRIYSLKARFPDYFLNQLRLNDRIIIKNRRYLINSISSNLVKREDTLELINDIYDAPFRGSELNTSFVFNTYANQTAYGFYTEIGSEHIFYYVGLAGKTVSLVDLGDGVSFVNNIDKTTATAVQSIIFRLSKNNTNAFRSVGIKIEDGLKDPIFYITQRASQTGAVTMDNNFYTYDNNIIKFDNG